MFRTRCCSASSFLRAGGTLCRKLLAAQATLLRGLPQPIVVVGDVHGDLHTLVRMLRTHGPPPETAYLFLGDYVDRCACASAASFGQRVGPYHTQRDESRCTRARFATLAGTETRHALARVSFVSCFQLYGVGRA